MDDPALGSVDVDAISDAIDALADAGIHVQDIDDVRRNGDDKRVRWTMTCEAETRTADLGDFTDD